MRKIKEILIAAYNFLGFPLRLILSHEVVNRLGLRSLRDVRTEMVLARCQGRLLDIGCGGNELVKKYGRDGVGVDVFDFGGGATIVKDSSQLLFPDASFDTVSFVASLNHIPDRQRTVREAHRLLSPGGRALVTALTPLVGLVRHKLAWWDLDQKDRGMKEGEVDGLTVGEVEKIFEEMGFRLVERRRFILGLNRLYVFEKEGK